MPEHPNAPARRAIFNAFWVDGDMMPMIEAMSPDYVWSNDEGAGPWRRLEGIAECTVFGAWWMEFFNGTFRYELIDVCASDDHVIEVLREVGEKDGNVFDNHALYLYRLGPDGKYESLQTYDRDRDKVREFWSHYPDVLDLDTRAVINEMLPLVSG